MRFGVIKSILPEKRIDAAEFPYASPKKAKDEGRRHCLDTFGKDNFDIVLSVIQPVKAEVNAHLLTTLLS
jgi:hypothetical protein